MLLLRHAVELVIALRELRRCAHVGRRGAKTVAWRKRGTEGLHQPRGVCVSGANANWSGLEEGAVG